MTKILVVEDDPRIVEAIRKSFSLEPTYDHRAVSDPREVLAQAAAYRPDLILLDIKLRMGDGRQIIRALKDNPATQPIPVIFLTGLSSESDRVLGLNLGADDYVVKPFGALELLARIQAVLRRAAPGAGHSPGELVFSGLVVDVAGHAVSLDGKPLRLQAMEFEVLLTLARRAGKTVARRTLIEATTRYRADVSSRSLDTHIKNLRRKLGRAGAWIQTFSKIGYGLIPPP